VATQSVAATKKTIRECFTTELHLERFRDVAVNDHSAEEIRDLTQLHKICKFETLCVYEKLESSWKSPRTLQKKKKVVSILHP